MPSSWSMTCPNCKKRLPWIWGDRYPKPEPGDFLECGMCGIIWQLKDTDDKKRPADKENTDHA